MNILFLSIGRLNDLEFRGIYTDLLRQFRDKGHKVYAVSPIEKRLKKPTEYVNENGVQFLRVRIGNITKTNVIEKGISTIMIENLFLKAIKKYMRDIKFDLVIYSTPPITFGKVISYVKKRDNAKSYLLLKDIFPQNAVDLNMFSKTSLIYKYFRLKEKQLYAHSDFIGCMSQANVDFVLNNNTEVPIDTVEVCPNSIEPLTIEKDETKIRRIRQKYNIPIDKTVFVYGGNLGKPQGIDFLIECLKDNKDNNQVYFVIAGSGTEFNKLKSFFNSKKLTNAQLFAQLPKDEYEVLVNSCDVGLIFLDKRFTIPNFPSRLLSYMQASMPVLATTDPNTDIGEVIEDGHFGYWCESSDVEEFNRKLNRLCDPELRSTMGENARKYLENNYTAKHSYEIIMKHFK
ncbi:glycosyltransferase family 4 protein [Alkalihalobacillus sp. MEB130]|uniref:glycosyltransferase family 4 protein n=1 Tax=Alkalihalobacillus sp. MEB130 TaxID=2976704 RepID=UPI0028DE2D66|nr:glycosyltransferase family 4 protein [Alkalihalobacillus sp. MEB130]MDT8860310.1 glycosyltransferase family 4 protein [Alkalihalobacillus sp. MEB130]